MAAAQGSGLGCGCGFARRINRSTSFSISSGFGTEVLGADTTLPLGAKETLR